MFYYGATRGRENFIALFAFVLKIYTSFTVSFRFNKQLAKDGQSAGWQSFGDSKKVSGAS